MTNKTTPRITWGRLSLLCEAVRRITRFHNGVPTGTGHGLGTATDYRSVVSAGLMIPTARNPRRGDTLWFKLTPKGERIVRKLMAAGVNYKHIEAVPKDAEAARLVRQLNVGALSFDVYNIFKRPERMMQTHSFAGERVLPTLDHEALKQFIPGGASN